MPLTQFESSIYPTLVRNASDLLEAKPWMSLESTDVFAVQNPDSDAMVFVQVSGGVDQEPFMLTAYRGSRGLEILWDLNNSPEEAFVSDLNYEVPALFFTYVTEDELDDKDKEVLEDVSLEGVEGYPVFRECRPGFQPNHPSVEDLRFLSHVIRQSRIRRRPRVGGRAGQHGFGRKASEEISETETRGDRHVEGTAAGHAPVAHGSSGLAVHDG